MLFSRENPKFLSLPDVNSVICFRVVVERMTLSHGKNQISHTTWKKTSTVSFSKSCYFANTQRHFTSEHDIEPQPHSILWNAQ